MSYQFIIYYLIKLGNYRIIFTIKVRKIERANSQNAQTG